MKKETIQRPSGYTVTSFGTPADILKAIKHQAKENHRSLSSEVTYRLWKSLKAEGIEIEL